MISVVLSFRNEADNLPELIRRLEAVLSAENEAYELLFVNDASTDDSLPILLEARRRNASIKIINMSRRFGVTPCVLAGFERAKGDAIIYMDTDLQDPPEVIPRLLEKWRAGADIVHTTRTLRRGENPLKMLLTDWAYRLIDLCSDIRILRNTGDFKLISRRAMNELLKLDEFDPFLRGLVAWVGFTQVQVFYERDGRFAGETKFSLLRSVNPYKEFIHGVTLFSTLPLYFALFCGLALSLASFLFLVALILVPLLTLGPSMISWNHILLGVILTINGMTLFTIGILGIYVGRIHREAINRPRFVVQEFIGGD